MPWSWNTCATCGASFMSRDPSSTDCGDKNKHARINTEKRTRKDPKGGKG